MGSTTRELLQEEARICHESIEWWKNEMSSLINESDEMEENPSDYPDFEERMEQIRAQMNYLLLKGEWENKELFKLQQKINKFRAEEPFSEADDPFESFKLIQKKEKLKRKKKK